MLKQRVITALIMAAIVIGIILLENSLWVSLLFTLGLAVATRELLKLTLKIPGIATWIFALIFAAAFWYSLQWVNPQIIYLQSLIGTGLWMLIAASMVFYRHHGHWPLLVRVMALGLGLDLIWICAHGLIYLHAVYGGPVLLFLLTLVCFADIGAYFCGRRFGRHKLAPTISPGKTWEGVAGGLGANLLWILIVCWLAQNLVLDGLHLSTAWIVLIGLATSAISVIGDLFESVLKREAGVKDSGSLLPGHGGVLDRADGIIAAAPVFVSGLFLASSS